MKKNLPVFFKNNLVIILMTTHHYCNDTITMIGDRKINYIGSSTE